MGLLFMGSPPLLGTHHLGCGESGAGVEPSDKHSPVSKFWGFARQIGKNALRDVVGEMPVAANAAQCGKIYHIDMPANELGEGLIRAIIDILAQQLGVFHCGGLRNELWPNNTPYHIKVLGL
jgi:hypothetical protein